MTNLKNQVYSKAYVELNEIINHLSKEEQEKISQNFKENLIDKMDKEYSFNFDSEKNIFEQEYLPETKALFINLYRSYLTSEKAFWNNYDTVCFKMIEKEKTKKYNTDNIFKNKIVKSEESEDVKIQNDLTIIEKKQNILKQVIEKIKKFFKNI